LTCPNRSRAAGYSNLNQYKYGRNKEKFVAKKLRKKGAKVKLSPGSRGAADIEATFKTKKWKVQIKSSRNGNPANPRPKDVGRLKASATKSKATPVIAKVRGTKVKYTSARNNRKLKP
jgi:Holliday junction resolvase